MVAACSDHRTPTPAAPRDRAAVVQPPTSRPATGAAIASPERTTARRLYHDLTYLKGAEANETYDDKWVQLTGRLSQPITWARAPATGTVVGLATAGDALWLNFTAFADQARLRRLRVGNKVTALCRVAP